MTGQAPAWKPWSIRIGALALAASTLAAAACGSSVSSSDKTATAAAGRPAAATTSAAATPQAATTPAATSAGPTVKLMSAAAGATLKDETGATVTQYLTDAAGRTLYHFKNDVPNSGKSAVPANILPNWPPLTLASGAPAGGSGVTGALGTMTGPDGATWVTYNGQPLYYFKGDAAPGDTKGEGLGNVWYVVAP
ncbi:MAG: COG4315 family predicted lipoprotein [Dehalococcoidia bacterium]